MEPWSEDLIQRMADHLESLSQLMRIHAEECDMLAQDLRDADPDPWRRLALRERYQKATDTARDLLGMSWIVRSYLRGEWARRIYLACCLLLPGWPSWGLIGPPKKGGSPRTTSPQDGLKDPPQRGPTAPS